MYKSIIIIANIFRGLGAFTIGAGVLFILFSLPSISSGTHIIAVLLQSVFIMFMGLLIYGSGAVLLMMRDAVEYLHYLAKSQAESKRGIKKLKKA